MKNLLIPALLLSQACMATAQHCCTADTTVREMQFPLTEQETNPVFYYFNDEWIPLSYENKIEADSIQKVEIKNDEYGNRAVFLTVSPEYLEHIKAENRKVLINLDPRCEFPGGNGKLKEWLEANIRVPEGFKGIERVVVSIMVNPEGSIIKSRISRPSKNEAANAEALRLVNALPKFRVRYATPRKHNLNYNIPITFHEPGAIVIRGCSASFSEQYPDIEKSIRQLYTNAVFGTATDPDFKITDICTPAFLQRLAAANDHDTPGYATWMLRSGMQDGDDTPSTVTSITPAEHHIVIVNWSDMGHKGSTTLTMKRVDGKWKIDNASVPEGFKPL